MSFVVEKRAFAAAPIKANVLSASGEMVEIDFVAQYRRYTHEKIVEIQNALLNRARSLAEKELIKAPDGSDIPEFPYLSDAALIRSELKGWVGAVDASGKEIPFTSDTADELMADYPELVGPLFTGFFSAHVDAALKNS